MLIKYIQPKIDSDLKNLYFDTRSGSSTAVFGVSMPLAGYIISNLDGKVLVLCKDGVTAKALATEITSFTGEDAVYLNPKDDVLLYKKFYNRESLFARITALEKIQSGARFVTAITESLLQLMPKKLDKIKLSIGTEYYLQSLLKDIVKMGYKRCEFAQNKGEFALRGDIFEIFPINSEEAFRCDFFGDEIEKIKILDVDTHIGGEEIRQFEILPAIDFCIEKDQVNGLIDRLNQSKSKVKTLHQSVKTRQICQELCELLESDNLSDSSLSYLYPLLNSTCDSIFDIFTGDITVVFIEPKLIGENGNSVVSEHTERCLALSRAGEALDFTINQIADLNKLFRSLTSKKCLALQNITAATSFFTPNKTLRINSSPVTRYTTRQEDLPRDLFAWQKSGYRAVIAAGTAERAKRLKDNLYQNGILASITETPYDTPGVYIVPTQLGNGFILHGEKLVVLGTSDLFVSAIPKNKLIKRRKDTFSAPEIGDFAVHEVHGIGLIRGTERISTLEGTKDYIAIEYAGGDFLYVPTEQMDKLTKYLGGDKSPHLNKIGGTEFDKIKQRVRESISRMTINLKKLYKDRATKKGFAFSPDSEFTKEFEDSFEFELTEDQAQSALEIKRDMESDKIMDRLLMGDVGFGKTEVALRAAFKAVMDLKQVAIMCPTTILSEQHFRTATARFKDFGVKIALLNRFVSPKKIKQYVEGIKDGTYSIIIGTHRILGKDVEFKDLGLLILDEEQAFGVEAKEKLRSIKNSVDTLTMTATPIPRTLHMSLSGIRDMSLINTPPVKRVPVQTYVLEESDALIKDAVLKELARGGQTFILYNRVETIDSFYRHIAQLLPEAKIVIGHGQMKKEQLENNVMAFFRGEYNVLICTTIIENGIDLPNANTLIVIDADNFGLFTLYQLKGRVGRSDRIAHAYFTFKPNKVLTDVAYKRLSTLTEHTQLGSGYKIAMRDLEIRGAGNVLGKEQHGHMDKIGYELYSKLLREQLGEVTKDYQTELDVRLDAFIPNEYISVSTSRMDAYKNIAEISSEADKQNIIKQLTTLYGKIPHQVSNLISIAELKYLCQKAEVIKVEISKQKAQLILKDINTLKNCGISDGLAKYKLVATLSFGTNPIVTIQQGAKSSEYNLGLVTEFLKFSLTNSNLI